MNFLVSDYVQQLEKGYGLRFRIEFVKEFKKSTKENTLSCFYEESLLKDIKNEVSYDFIGKNIDSSSFNKTYMKYDNKLYNKLIDIGCNPNNKRSYNFENPNNFIIFIDEYNYIGVAEQGSIGFSKAIKDFQKVVFKDNDFYESNHCDLTLLELIRKKDDELNFLDNDR